MNELKLELWYPVKDLLVTQGFCENRVPYYKQMGLLGHNGIDMLARTGQPVRAAHDGEVTFAGEDGQAGLGVVLRTLEQFDYKGQLVYFKSIYWHLDKGSIKVVPGQKVKVGDILGGADTTGLATSCHLHFGIKPILQGEQAWLWDNVAQSNGYHGAIDPSPYFNGFFAEDSAQVNSKLSALIALLKQALALFRK